MLLFEHDPIRKPAPVIGDHALESPAAMNPQYAVVMAMPML
jgi:hypothetical protein